MTNPDGSEITRRIVMYACGVATTLVCVIGASWFTPPWVGLAISYFAGMLSLGLSFVLAVVVGVIMKSGSQVTLTDEERQMIQRMR